MKIKISVIDSKDKVTVYENVYEISEEGDISNSVSMAISEARKIGLSPFDWSIVANKA